MKAVLSNGSKKIFFGLAALLFFAFFTNGFGQIQRLANLTSQKSAKENLVMAIQSENDGVRESAVYFVGKYRLIDLEDALIFQLKVETNPDIKVLIGLALFRMDSEKGMEVLSEYKTKDSNPRVKKMFTSIYNEFQISNVDNKTAIRY
jgi:hypothetical protein